MKIIKFYFAILLLISIPISGEQELISNLHSKIIINPDSSLTITESITINAEHQQIKRGITRSFPTEYQNRLGDFTHVSFNVIETLLDNQPCSYFLTSAPNGVVVNFGDNNYIAKGEHVYKITYQTNRQLAFKDNWTELYFNIVGNNVIFPILKASAEIYLPNDINPDKIELNGYTGFFGNKNHDYQAWITRPNICHFKTNKTLHQGQSFTISVAFPNSTQIKKPSFFTKLNWFIRDNLALAILIFMIILLLIIYSCAYYKIYQNKPVIMPLFNAPNNMLPAECAFLYHKSFKNTALTATIIDMAVHGYLKIRHTPGSLIKKESYILEKNPNPPKITNHHYDRLSEIWFDKNSEINLDSNSYNTINKILAKLKFIAQKCADYIKPINNMLLTGILLSIGAIVIAIYLRSYNPTPVCILIFFLIAINIIFYYLLQDYTPAGKQLYAQIDGFRMYLEYAGKDRIQRLNPPSMTIEQFEKYLPYAIALDVDRAWQNAFEHIYLQTTGQVYHPHWWLSHRFNSHDFNSNLNSLHNNLNTIITPKAAPGSSSGRFGGGFSGGGGGGGGIGGR